MSAGLEVRLQGTVGQLRLEVDLRTTASTTALIGPSGAGKSVTLRAIAGLVPGLAGRVCVDGVVWQDDGVHLPTRARRVGMMFQDLALFPHLNVGDNIGFGLAGPDRRSRIEALAERMEIGHCLQDDVRALSGGQRQRVALARALAPRPALLLLDEPFSSVDAGLRDRLRQQVREVTAAEGVRVLMVTHDPEDVAVLASEVAKIEGGACVFSDVRAP